jgi:hypothetical protein
MCARAHLFREREALGVDGEQVLLRYTARIHVYVDDLHVHDTGSHAGAMLGEANMRVRRIRTRRQEGKRVVV